MAVHLVRHGDAGAHRPHDDEHRPLSGKGRRRAEAVRDALAGAAPPSRILSSRYTRCLETVRPLGRRLALAVEPHPALAEEADLGASWALVEHLAGLPGDSVACSHGNVLGGILDRAAARGIDLVAAELSCRKGSIWRLDVDGAGRIDRAVLALRPG
jgi:8-oxo-dGTP diphosphatase